ncbi:MAG: hypothetical protein GY852_07010 [bacterium]|nr:hypothetical protein [bacterium]
MLRYAFFALLFISLSFSVVGEQCPDLKQYCIQNACPKAGGEINEYGFCTKGATFDEQRYQEELDLCDATNDYCVENDGVVRNMSCCGPIFIFLFALLALYADGTR